MGSEFDGACTNALTNSKKTTPLYDAILIDEAQDFPPSFLRLCFNILGDKKRLVYAYDELQSLKSQSLPSPEHIFGSDNSGNPLVQLTEKSQDIILEKCYRNSKPVLTTAHALGFGIYRDIDQKTGTGLVQMFNDSQLWKDVGYVVAGGELSDGKDVSLERTNESSPNFLSEHSNIDDLIQFHSFENDEQQEEWIVENIIKNLEEDELRVDDIIVINPDPLKTKRAVGTIRSKLFERKVNSHLAGVDTTPDIFFNPEHHSIAFTGIHRAKGNEAGMVYIINSQDCFDSFGKLPTVRNQLFTAITRSKAWVRILGIGMGMDKLKEEYERVKENSFNLSFNYPDANLRSKLNIVNRDMSEHEKKEVKKAESTISDLLFSLDRGDIQVEDLDASQIARLRQIISNEE